MEGGTTPSVPSNDPASSRTSASGTLEKPRSCAICAQRKVRCDKQYPCIRCRRAGIQCVLPSVDHRPRYARHLVLPSGGDAEASSTQPTPAGMAVDKILDRLKLLEGLVRDLSGELKEARTASTAAASRPGSQTSEASSMRAADAGAATPQAGRIVLDDDDRVRYVSSGFWSRIDYELDGLKEDTRGYEEDEVDGAFEGDPSHSKSSSSAVEADRSPLDRHAFLLKHNLRLTNGDTSTLLPMASQIPFLLEVFSERVHFIIGLPHIPSLRKYIQHRRSGGMERSSPGEEALIFSVFYAAICALDDDEVTTSFNVSKNELILKYRIGLEQALARADFLNNPSVVLVQGFLIFLALARRHDSPKFVWVMTGLVVRMAHYLGIHHDGSGSKHITPFQVEMQRRIWWGLCILDMRGAEDQGTELAIPHGSYSTRIPSNINDADIWPEMKQSPLERQGLTDVTLLRLCSNITRNIQEMTSAGAAATIHDHNNRLNELTRQSQRDYFNFAHVSQNHAYLAAAGWMRIALGRITLLAFLPILHSCPSINFSTEIRTKLLIAGIEVAEHNHALNSDASCQPWRWVYQTQQQWHAVVYILIEIYRRPWSSTMERAWLILQSPWLVPGRAPIDKNFSVWVPLRRLMARARKHRANEIIRLRNDPDAAAQIEREDQQQIPVPSSSTTFPTYFEPETFRTQWRQLVRPVAATTTNSLSDTSVTAFNDHYMTNLDVQFRSPPEANRLPEMAPLPHDNQPAFAATLNKGVASPASAPWPGASTDLTDYSNLDTFLGTDTEMELVDVMNDGDSLGFDWNSWFESAKGVL